MTNPDYVQEVIMHQREDTRLHRTREYLERAKQTYAETGGNYSLSKIAFFICVTSILVIQIII